MARLRSWLTHFIESIQSNRFACKSLFKYHSIFSLFWPKALKTVCPYDTPVSPVDPLSWPWSWSTAVLQCHLRMHCGSCMRPKVSSSSLFSCDKHAEYWVLISCCCDCPVFCSSTSVLFLRAYFLLAEWYSNFNLLSRSLVICRKRHIGVVKLYSCNTFVCSSCKLHNLLNSGDNVQHLVFHLQLWKLHSFLFSNNGEWKGFSFW